MGAEFLFMNDNARPHRANIVDECLQSEDITRMDWLAYSPDLNPIEHVWDMLGRRIAARQPLPTCLPELRRALLDEWCNIPRLSEFRFFLHVERSCFSSFSAPEIQFFSLPQPSLPSLPFINQRVGSFFFSKHFDSRCKTSQGFISYAYGIPHSHLHIFSGLVVKKLPSSSVSPSGPPTEDRSNAPTDEALDDAYQHIRDLEKQVALSEGKLQESQRCVSTRSFLAWLHTLNQPFPV
ncbi:transposable element Tcb1 transposase [Trichonephila clavipes]|nr:transposable element Tcb1 transposase [Trichonephila clavipes]